jgi:hypothetical protein
MIGFVGLFDIILGLGLLLAGRKLFWLFVAAAGFILGAQVTIRTFNGPDWLGLIIGIIVGIIFALLAIFLRVIAIGIAGFLMGGSIFLGLVEMLDISVGGFTWAVYIVGGLLGILLVSVVFDWALITLSSLAGAALITRELVTAAGVGRTVVSVIFIILLFVGILFQGAIKRREKASDD